MPLSRLIDHFEAKAALCRSDRDLSILLDDGTRELGFDFFALLHHASLASHRPGLIRLDSYPAEWEDELAAQGLLGADPVHHASIRTNVGFAWSQLPAMVPIGERERLLLERAKRFGIADGYTVPVNVPGEPGGSCSFAVRPGKTLPLGRLLCAEQLGAHAFCTARRIHGFPAAGPPAPHLSPRERQCVRLIVAGKTDWEIAAILGLSVETVHQYVKRARAAYDVVSRAQLVACVLRDAIVTFEEAIPPFGRIG